MNFNFLNDSAIATSPSFTTEEFSGCNEDNFGTLVESCFKTIDKSQIKYHSQEQEFATFLLEDFIEEKPFHQSDHNLFSHQPRSYGTQGPERCENDNAGIRSYTTTKSIGKPKKIFDNIDNLIPGLEYESFATTNDLFDVMTNTNEDCNGIDKSLYSLIKTESDDDIFNHTMSDSFFTNTDQDEIFPSIENLNNFQSFSEPCYLVEEVNRRSNYTYGQKHSGLRTNNIDPSYTVNSISATNCGSDFNNLLPERQNLNISKCNGSKFIKGSKNRICTQREFTYDGINIESYLEPSDKLINVAKNEEPYNFQDLLSNKLLELKVNKEHSICCIKRNRYVRRNFDTVLNFYRNVGYELNPRFHISKPYEPQYVRFEIDEKNGLPFNETRCGLCPYCPNLNFKNLKTSTYSQHLALTHGVYTDNYLTPNPLYYGVYIIKKTNTHRRTKAHEHERCGVVCPCCYAIVGTECSKTTASLKPLNNYMRHFKEYHRQSKGKLDPIKFFNKVVPLN